MKGYLRARNSGLGNGIGLALANGDYRDAVLLGDYLGDCLEDCLDFNVLVGHDKLVVVYLYAALYDLPLLEAEALLGSSGEGNLGVFNGCLCGCGCSAVFIGRHSDAVRDGIGVGSRGQYRKLKDSIICISHVVGAIHEQILCRAVACKIDILFLEFRSVIGIKNIEQAAQIVLRIGLIDGGAVRGHSRAEHRADVSRVGADEIAVAVAAVPFDAGVVGALSDSSLCYLSLIAVVEHREVGDGGGYIQLPQIEAVENQIGMKLILLSVIQPDSDSGAGICGEVNFDGFPLCGLLGVYFMILNSFILFAGCRDINTNGIPCKVSGHHMPNFKCEEVLLIGFELKLGQL